MKNKIFTFSALLLAGAGLAFARPTNVKANDGGANGAAANDIKVTAKAGDTVWGFAQQYD